MSRRLLLALALQGLLVACSGSTPSPAEETHPPDASSTKPPVDAAACSFTGPAPAAPAPAAASASHEAQAEAGGLAFYDAVIGRFLRGETQVYRGTMNAAATTGLNALSGPDSAHTTIAEGPALATLEVQPADPGNWYPAQTSTNASGKTAVLIIHGLTAHAYVDYAQTETDPSTTWAGGIASDDVTKGVSDDFLDTSCDKCLPSLWTKPSALTLDKVTTTATVQEYEGVVNQGGMTVEVPIKTVTTASLTLASPCGLEWKDLQHLNTVTGPNAFAVDAGLQSFTLTGGEWVSHQSGSFVTPNQGSCPTYTDYSIDVYVDATNLGSHGVRNYKVGTSTTECPP